MLSVGQKVVYVGGLSIHPDDPVTPDEGKVYTISWVGMVPAPHDCVNIDLVELPQPETSQIYRGYDQSAFRPVVERDTDISIFKKMLTPTSKGTEPAL